MTIRIVQLGASRRRGEGIRFGTVRRPPRGVRKTQYKKQNWYDVWLPNLSPNAKLIEDLKNGLSWTIFKRRFVAELKQPDKSHLLDALAALSHTTNFSIGCYCEDEQRCHRIILRAELERRKADIK
jgi:uncharacterized protein YeaO (DUF488 family)